MSINNVGIGLSSLIRNQTGNGDVLYCAEAVFGNATASSKSLRIGSKNFALRTINSDGRYCLSIVDLIFTGSVTSSSQYLNLYGKSFGTSNVTINSISYKTIGVDSGAAYTLSTSVFSWNKMNIGCVNEKPLVYVENIVPTSFSTISFGNRNIVCGYYVGKWYFCVNLV